MKRLSALLVLCLLLVGTVFSAPTVSLAWDPSPDADVSNYRLYWGPGSGSYNGNSDLGNVTNTVFTQLVPGGHYYFVVTALNAAGLESDPSNEIDYFVPITPPTNFRIDIQTSSNLVTWQTTTNVALPIANAAAFYRLAIAPEGAGLQSTGLRAAAVQPRPKASPVLTPVKAPFSTKHLRVKPKRAKAVLMPPLPK